MGVKLSIGETTRPIRKLLETEDRNRVIGRGLNQISSMANPRRVLVENQSLSPLIHLLKKPQAFPFLLTLFLLLTWISLRLQHSSYLSSPSSHQKSAGDSNPGGGTAASDDDEKVNLVRFHSESLRKDDRGWLLNPVSLAFKSQIKGGAVSCVSIHVGEIRPGRIRGNHRHHTCNETFVLWGAKTKFRVENHVLAKGFTEALIGEDEVAIVASPSGTAHALVNIDPVRTTFFLGCQDSNIQYNSSTSDFNIWKDL